MADYSNWMAELDKYASSGPAGGGTANMSASLAASSTVSAGGTRSTVEELEAEMKLLHWHKLANEAALKAALIRTKRLRKKDKRAISTASSQRQQEKVAWMQRIVEEEQMKPLEVTDDFIRQYEERERAEAEVLEKEVQRHISNLKSLKQNLKKREEEKRRHANYKRKKTQLAQPVSMASVEQPTSDTGGESAGPDPAHGVLASLDKLVELEQRIAGLEAGGGSGGGGGASQRGGTPGSRMSARSRGSAASRGAATGGTQLVFKKKRHATRLDAPAKTTYAVHMVGAGQRGSGRSSRDGTRRTAGQDALLRRSQARRNRQARESQRGQRQDAVINNWLSERKTKQAQRRARNASGAGARRAAAARTRYRTARAQRDSAQTGGGARVRRAGTHHQQQFHDVRRQFEDTRSRANRIISNTGPSRYGNSRRGAGASSRRRAAPKYGVERSGATGGSFRFSTRGSAGAGAGSGAGAGARPQLGSRLGGSSASTRSRTTRATRTRTTRTRTTRTRTTRTTRMARTTGASRNTRSNRSSAAQRAAARAAARRKAANTKTASTRGTAAQRRAAAGRNTRGRSKGFGGASRFRTRSTRGSAAAAPKQQAFGVAGNRMGQQVGASRTSGYSRTRGSRGSRATGSSSRYAQKQRYGGRHAARQGTTLPVIRQRSSRYR